MKSFNPSSHTCILHKSPLKKDFFLLFPSPLPVAFQFPKVLEDQGTRHCSAASTGQVFPTKPSEQLRFGLCVTYY